MFERKPRGATEEARIRDAVSRMAAVFVLAAGGEIKVPHQMMRDADYIELEQVDCGGGAVIYRAKPYRRAAAGPIIEGTVETSTVRLVDGRWKEITDGR